MLSLSANGHFEYFADGEDIHLCCSSTTCNPEQEPENSSDEERSLCNPFDGCPNCLVFYQLDIHADVENFDPLNTINIYCDQFAAKGFLSLDDPPPKFQFLV